MPVYQELVSFDEVFKTLRHTPIVINDLPSFSQEDKEKIKRYTHTVLSDDSLSSLPSCDCGETKGEYNIGTICKACFTPVRNSIEDAIEPVLWFRRPEGIRKLINPIVWTMLNNRFRKSGTGICEWLIDPNCSKHKNKQYFDNIEATINPPRGYNNFIDNFDSIMEWLFSIREFSTNKRSNINKRDYLFELIQRDRDKVFSDYWPIINKTLLIIETTNVAIYMDPLVKEGLNITNMFINIEKTRNIKTQERRLVSALDKLTTFYDAFNKKIVLQKTGMLRKHVFATRTHFSFRAVIIGNMGIHQFDELWMPWSIGITAFREHLINKLFKRGYKLLDAINLLYYHVYIFHPLLDDLLKELINESPYNGIPVIFQRNPSLAVGSGQLFRITRFKTDVDDQTISYSIMCVTAPNADFDGDEMNGTILLDNELINECMKIVPAASIFTMTQSPGDLSGYNTLSKPVVATANNWLTSTIDTDKEKYRNMEQLFC